MQLAGDRRSERRSVDFACNVVRMPGLEMIGDRAIELSPHGMLVVSDAACSIGDTVLVTFDVPGTESSITTSARVARLAPGRRSGDPGKAFGVEFEGLDAASERLLRGALEHFPEARAMRPPRVDYAATASMIALDE